MFNLSQKAINDITGRIKEIDVKVERQEMFAKYVVDAFQDEGQTRRDVPSDEYYHLYHNCPLPSQYRIDRNDEGTFWNPTVLKPRCIDARMTWQGTFRVPDLTDSETYKFSLALVALPYYRHPLPQHWEFGHETSKHNFGHFPNPSKWGVDSLGHELSKSKLLVSKTTRMEHWKGGIQLYQSIAQNLVTRIQDHLLKEEEPRLRVWRDDRLEDALVDKLYSFSKSHQYSIEGRWKQELQRHGFDARLLPQIIIEPVYQAVLDEIAEPNEREHA